MTPDQPKRAAVEVVRPHIDDVDWQLAFARHVHARGFARLWMSEVSSLEPVALAGMVRVAVPDLPLALGPLPAPLRTAPQLAMAAATLARVAGDLELILGASSPAVVAGWHGRDVTRLRQVSALIGTYRNALSGKPTDCEDPLAPSKGFRLGVAPAYHVPIGLAALGPKMRQLAAHTADHLVLNYISAPRAQALRQEFLTEAIAAGRPAGARVTVWLHIAVEASAEDRDVCRAFVARYVRAPGYRENFADMGHGDIVDRARKAGGFPAVVDLISDELLDAVMVLGGAQAARDAIDAYTRRGINVAVTCPLSNADAVLRTVDAVSPSREPHTGSSDRLRSSQGGGQSLVQHTQPP